MKLGASQFLIGCLAGWKTCSAQSMVSHAESGQASGAIVRRARAALVWLEAQPRREREAKRQDERQAALTEAALADVADPTNAAIVAARLVDLLLEGRSDDFDVLAARCPGELVDEAGEAYLDQCKPRIPGRAA